VYTESDHIPGSYFLGFRNEKELIFLFNQYPELAAFTEKIEHRLIKYKARDGAKIEGYLSLPPDMKAPFPLIVHPHGGPESRDFGGFDYWTSFFVNLGYAVFRPNFRGSSGYGYSFARSQMQAWGLSMQDDITDGVHRLIRDNIVDKEKICIVGASYGGYAAAMGAIKTPELFKCAISFAGVMNLKELVHDYRNSYFRIQIEKQLGEDSDDLKARSPYYLAEKVNIPILLAHGEDDRRVKIEQSQEMFEELQELGKDVSYLELKHGDHYLSVQKNRHQLFTAMEKFLTTHLSTTSD
jgi:dipeptidyl aminopeptidase/acylaminoacyl peptidase